MKLTVFNFSKSKVFLLIFSLSVAFANTFFLVFFQFIFSGSNFITYHWSRDRRLCFNI